MYPKLVLKLMLYAIWYERSLHQKIHYDEEVCACVWY